MTPTSSPQCSSPFLRRALGGGEAPLCAQIGANPPTHPRQFHCRGTGVLLGCQLGARWCLASSLTCDFNMIKNYTHDWLLLVAAYHASAPVRLLVHVTYTRFFAARAEWARGPHSVGAVRRNSTAGPIRILTVAVLQPAIGAHSRISTQERPQVRPTPTPLHHRHAFFAPFFTDRLPRDHAHPSIVSPKSARRSVPMPCYRSMV